MPSKNIVDIEKLSDEQKVIRIVELKKLVKDNTTLKGLQDDDVYLKRFLASTQYDVDAAYERMVTFYELLLEFPDWFTKESPLEKKELIEKEIRLVVPNTDREGRPIYLIKIGNCDVNTMELLEVISVDDIMLETIVDNQNIQEKGLCVIIDIHNTSWKMMKWITPHNIKTAVKKILCYPVKEYKIHVVRNAFFINAALKIILPFLPQVLKDMIKFHFNDLESFHKYVDPNVLPPEYGGTSELDFNENFKLLFEQDNTISESFRNRRALMLANKNLIN